MKLNDRVCYGTKFGMLAFGKIIKIMPEEKYPILIQGDDGQIYQGTKDTIIVLNKEKENE